MQQDNNLIRPVEPKNALRVRQLFESGDFFAQSREWYYEKYASQYRTKLNLLIFIGLFGLFLVFSIFMIFDGVSKVKARIGVAGMTGGFEDVFLISKLTKYYPNNEKNVIRYVVEQYVKEFESFDYDKYSVFKISEKIKTISGFSSPEVARQFTAVARNDYTSDIFENRTRSARVIYFEFIESDEPLARLTRALMPEKTPIKAHVYAIITTFDTAKNQVMKEENKIVEITYKFKPLEKDKNGNFEDLDFEVIKYEYIDV